MDGPIPRTIPETLTFLLQFGGDDEVALKHAGMTDDRIESLRPLFGTCALIEVLHSYFRRKRGYLS